MCGSKHQAPLQLCCWHLFPCSFYYTSALIFQTCYFSPWSFEGVTGRSGDLPCVFCLCACFYWPSDWPHCLSVLFRALLMIYCTLWESSLQGQLYKPSQASGIYFYQTEQLLLRKNETPTSRATCGWPRLVRTPLTSVQLKRCDSPFNSRLWEAHVIIMHLLCQRSQQRRFCLYLLPAANLLSSTRFLSFCWFYSGTKRTLLNCLCGLFSWALKDSRLLPQFYPTLYHMHNTLNAWRRLVCVRLTLLFFSGWNPGLTSGCQVRSNSQSENSGRSWSTQLP